MKQWKSLADIRREYGDLRLDEASIQSCPFNQFELWFSEIIQTELADPTAMILSTVDESGFPDSRVVLLKGIENNTFVFYTNYLSKKSKQIENNDKVALNFYWPTMARQVRIRGNAVKVSVKQSDDYFASRPRLSQLSAIASIQSKVIDSREELEHAFNSLAQAQQELVLRPEYWGGYCVTPIEFEFWQGRDNRLHDRMQYVFKNEVWIRQRLSP